MIKKELILGLVTCLMLLSTVSAFVSTGISNPEGNRVLEGYADSVAITTPNQTWLDFDGVNDFINMTYSDLKSNEITIQTKIKGTGNYGSSFPHIYSGSCSSCGYKLFLNGGSNPVFYVFNGSDNIQAQLSGEDVINEITLTGRSDNTDAFLFVDVGGNIEEVSLGGGAVDFTGIGEIKIGNRGTDSRYFNGSIYYLKVWNRSLTNNEILYSASEGADYVPWLGYHMVGDDAGINNCDASVSRFTGVMSSLASNGYTSITPENYYQWTQGNYTLPNKPIIITFDDGLQSVYDNAFPIMQTYGLVGFVAVISERPSNPLINYTYLNCNSTSMNWTNLQELVDAGWEIGSHTVNHTIMLSIADNPSEMIYQLNESRNQINGNLTDFEVSNFVYPQASRNETTDEYVSMFYHTSPANSDWGINFAKMENYYNLGRRFCANRSYHDCIQSTTDSVEVTDESINDYLIYYHLNEYNGTTAYDASGNGNNGSISGAIWQTDGAIKTLTSGVDYSITKVLGEYFDIAWLNPEYQWSYFTVTYTTLSEDFNWTREAIEFIILILPLIGIMVAYLIIKKDMNLVVKKPKNTLSTLGKVVGFGLFLVILTKLLTWLTGAVG
jgi:peptidoglycan/xylan/chitin deacetylase (PgdA/CDA1 family)